MAPITTQYGHITSPGYVVLHTYGAMDVLGIQCIKDKVLSLWLLANYITTQSNQL